MGFLENLKRIDNFWIGIVLGIAIPLALYPIVRPLDPENFAFISKAYHITIIKLLPLLLSRCVFPNALIFFIFIWVNYDKAAKGILYSTIGIVAILFILRLFF